MQVHEKLKKTLKDNKLVSPFDHLRSCGDHGFTDLAFTKLDLKITSESKYFIAININNKPIILSHPNFYDFRQEINEKMIEKNYYGGYDKNKNRVILHYKGDGKFRVGNKKGSDEFLTSFEECNFHQLTKRSNYKSFIKFLPNNEKHRALQVLICELGISQGYNVKIARNDKKSILLCDYKSDIENDLISIKDIELSSIVETNAKDNIDLIDVLWYESNSKHIIAAFEVERSKNYDAALRRFSYTTSLPYSPYLICVGDDYFGFKNSTLNPMFYNWFKNSNLKYLTLDSLYTILNDNDKYGRHISINLLFNKHLIDVI